MRTLVAVVLFTAACTAHAPGGAGSSESVRERLAASRPTRLVVAGEASSGEVTAQRWTPGGWVAGDTALTIDSGELSVATDRQGTLAVSHFEVALAPIAIPDEVFGKPAQLSDVRVVLREPAAGALAWNGDDAATARVSLALELEWAIAIDGGRTPLGHQELPAIDVDVDLLGDGDVVDAQLGLAATGELWSWAGLLQMTHLELALDAQTSD